MIHIAMIFPLQIVNVRQYTRVVRTSFKSNAPLAHPQGLRRTQMQLAVNSNRAHCMKQFALAQSQTLQTNRIIV